MQKLDNARRLRTSCQYMCLVQGGRLINDNTRGVLVLFLLRLPASKVFCVGCKGHASFSRQANKNQILGLHLLYICINIFFFFFFSFSGFPIWYILWMQHTLLCYQVFARQESDILCQSPSPRVLMRPFTCTPFHFPNGKLSAIVHKHNWEFIIIIIISSNLSL